MSFAEFYPEYLAEHKRPLTKLFHVAGTLGLFASVAAAALLPALWLVLIGVVAVYAAAWFSHFAIERNRPKTFQQPLYSVLGDFKMTFDVLTRRIPLDGRT